MKFLYHNNSSSRIYIYIVETDTSGSYIHANITNLDVKGEKFWPTMKFVCSTTLSIGYIYLMNNSICRALLWATASTWLYHVACLLSFIFLFPVDTDFYGLLHKSGSQRR